MEDGRRIEEASCLYSPGNKRPLISFIFGLPFFSCSCMCIIYIKLLKIFVNIKCINLFFIYPNKVTIPKLK